MKQTWDADLKWETKTNWNVIRFDSKYDSNICLTRSGVAIVHGIVCGLRSITAFSAKKSSLFLGTYFVSWEREKNVVLGNIVVEWNETMKLQARWRSKKHRMKICLKISRANNG